MARKKVPYEPQINSDFRRESTLTAPNGRHIEVGTELSFKGVRGRFRFHEHVCTPMGKEWVTVVGGPEGIKQFRSFAVDRIKTVHSKEKLRD